MTIVAPIVAGLIAFAIAGLYERWRDARFESAMRLGRLMVSTEVVYRQLGAGELVQHEHSFEAVSASLIRSGFLPFADVAGEGHSVPSLLMRCFADTEGATFAYLILGNRRGASVMVLLESYPDGEEFSTMWGTTPSYFAMPPFMHREVHPPGLPLDELIARHRAFVGAERVLPRITTPDELVAVLQSRHALLVGWRADQAPDELLEQDLRGFLGKRFDRLGLGAKWMKRLKVELPAATIRQ